MTKIHAAVCSMLADVEEIKKNRDNKQQGYKFRGIDDVYNAVHPLLAKHRVFPACEVLETRASERETKAGGSLFCVHIKAKYTFWAEDGSSVATEALGEGMDSADKASNKAMSSAYKYALFQLLCIPTEAVDSEEDSHEVKPLPKKEAAKQAAPKTSMTAAQVLASVPTLETLTRIKACYEFCEKELVAKRYTAAQVEDVCLALAEKAITLCDSEADYGVADQLVRDMQGKMRIPDDAGMTLRIKINDAKEAKFAAAA
jgi:hypothetical protein